MPSPALRARIISAACVLITIACGLAVRRFIGGAIGEHLGNVAWGVMWVLIEYTITLRARSAALGGLFFVVGIECFQLTPYPAAWSSESVIARYALGGAFEVRDLVGSAVGVALAWFVLARAR
ncbi:MAG: DUF2809 domain-containing protein [Phycisphaerales bacterium]